MILTRVIGMDLGTTNSAVATLEPNERDLVLCEDSQGRPTIPSCVWSNPRTGELVVGHRAYARRGSSPQPISSIKRSMGTQMMVDLAGKPHSPAEISAFILGELKGQMQAALETRSSDGLRYEVERAIITVPAYFGLPAIEATREAGRLAGLEVTELLHEPTAAAIYYSWKHDLGDGIYLVYDLGGGTFDVSVLRRISGEFLVLGISGDNFLGGDDFDRRLAEYLRQLLIADGYDLDLDVASDPEDQLRISQLMALAERTKKALSTQEEYVLRDTGTLRDKSGDAVVVELSITRATFNELIGDLIDRTLLFCQDALNKARHKAEVTIEDVDHVLLVGGSTYVPAVPEKVRQALCRGGSDQSGPCTAAEQPIRDEPETAVALGAALRAAASGLGVGDDEKRVRLWFRGSGATRREEATITGRVEALQEGLDLEGALLRLISTGGVPIREVTLGSGLHFAFRKVPLQTEFLNEFRLELLDPSGEMVADLQRSIVQASDQKEAVGSALSTAVLSKPILLEGTDGDRLVRRVLLVEGTSLPAKAQFTFAVADASGTVRLPIYQESRIIKELQANVGEVAVGTPVVIEIACDEQVRIQVRSSIGDQQFGGSIEPPGPDAVATEYEVQETDERFREVLARLEAEDASRLGEAYARARKDLDEARAGTDYPKVIQRAADLEGLVREARLCEPLSPPLGVVENNLASCLELLPQAVKLRGELGESSLKRDLHATMEKARQAYRQRDRRDYEDACKAIGTALQFLGSLTRAKLTEDSDVDVAVRAAMALDQTRGITQFVLIHCLFSGHSEFTATLAQRLEELTQLAEEADENPNKVLNRCQVLTTEARRIHRQVTPEEKGAAEFEGLLQMSKQTETGAAGVSNGLFDRS